MKLFLRILVVFTAMWLLFSPAAAYAADGDIGTEIGFNFAGASTGTIIVWFAVSIVIPGLSSLLNLWHNNVAGFITILLSTANGLLLEALKGGDDFDWGPALLVAGATYGLACLARLQLWAGTRVDNELQQAGKVKRS